MTKQVWWTANQPLYFPAMYMIERFARCEHVVIMEEAQFSKFGHQSRALIGTKQGHHQLVLPLSKKFRMRLCDVKIHDPERWLRELKKTLQSVYGRQRYYDQIAEKVLYWMSLVLTSCEFDCFTEPTQRDIGSATILLAQDVLELPFKVSYSTILVPDRPEDPNDWVIALGKEVGGNCYVGGKIAMDAYADMAKWNMAGQLYFPQDWKMPPYKALWGTETDGNVSFLDPLFLHGPDCVREMVGL